MDIGQACEPNMSANTDEGMCDWVAHARTQVARTPIGTSLI